MKLGSGAFEGAFTFASRVEEGPGTNPEELVGAAQAGCFSMFLAAVLTGAGFPPKQIRTSAKVHLGEGPRIDLHGAAPAQHAVPAGGSVDNFLSFLLQDRPTNGIEKESYAWRTRLGQAVRRAGIELDTEAEVPNVDEKTLQEKVDISKKNCPISLALSGPELRMSARLA